MKQRLLSKCLLLLLPAAALCQTKITINPYVKALTNIKDGYFETGMEWSKANNNGRKFSILPFLRLPLTNKDQNLLSLDRFTNTWRGVIAFQSEYDPTTETGNMSVFTYGGQLEWGQSEYKYYPLGNKASENKQSKSSIAAEIKLSLYTGIVSGTTKQKNYQIRLRYAAEAKASKEVGVVTPANSNGVITTSNMVIAAPSRTPVFSPAFAYQTYHGKGKVSYTNAIYYDITGLKNSDNPFNDLQRLRYEFWVFYFPIIPNSPNVKVGFGPFISFRTKGSDDFNKIEYGGQVTVKVGSLFQSFF